MAHPCAVPSAPAWERALKSNLQTFGSFTTQNMYDKPMDAQWKCLRFRDARCRFYGLRRKGGRSPITERIDPLSRRLYSLIPFHALVLQLLHIDAERFPLPEQLSKVRGTRKPKTGLRGSIEKTVLLNRSKYDEASV
jgi:hypothetical protein